VLGKDLEFGEESAAALRVVEEGENEPRHVLDERVDLTHEDQVTRLHGRVEAEQATL